jgi:hypothetical protein
MIIIPIMSYAGAILLVRWDAKTKWIPIPKEFAMTIKIPFVDWSIRYFGANLVVALVLALVGFAVLMSLYALVYRAVGPQGSPLDAPPIRRKTRRSR